jgi:hypothetical protein
VPSMEDPFVLAGFTVVIEGAANQADWRAVVVADPVWEKELLLGWEIELLPGDYGGWNSSLAKRES